MNTQRKVFRSRISVILLFSILIIFIPISKSVIQSRDEIGIYAAGGLIIFILFIFTGLRYIVSGNNLVMKLWFIPIASINILEINSVKRSYNPLSSPAASLKRLAVYRSNKTESLYLYALISPVREQEFLDELKTINPCIKVNVPEKREFWHVWDWDI